MKFIRNNWFYLVLIAFALTALALVIFNPELELIQRILLASLLSLPLHQFEEYIFPGGGPVVINRYFFGNEDNYRACPGNWNSVMVVNMSAYVFYILALLFPKLIWLGIGTMFFNLFQVLGHCFQMNIKMKAWYNPGMVTSLVLFLPISIYYLTVITTNGIVSGLDWVVGVAMFVAMTACCVILPIQLTKNPNTPYLIPQQQVDLLEKVKSWASVKR